MELGLKYKIYVNPEHEFMLSLGVFREFGRTGATGDTAAALDVDQTGSTTPTIFWGKGLGDLPIGLLRPLAITGTLGYSVADQKLKVTSFDPDTGMPCSTMARPTYGPVACRCNTACATCRAR